MEGIGYIGGGRAGRAQLRRGVWKEQKGRRLIRDQKLFTLLDWGLQAYPCCWALTFFSMFIYFWEREREYEWGKGQRERERERETESKAGSRLCAVSTEPDMTWAEVGHLTDWATQAPHPCCWAFRSKSCKSAIVVDPQQMCCLSQGWNLCQHRCCC